MFFPSLFFFFVKPNATCARGMHRFLRRVAVASLLCHPRRRRDDAHRERARGWKGREREREAERFFVFLWTRIGNLKSRIENGRFFSRRRRRFCWYCFRTLLREGDILIALTSFAFSHSSSRKNRFAERTGT